MDANHKVTINSHNYPNYYFDNIDCTWFFRSTNSTGSFVIRILDMQLFALRGYDDIRIGRGYNRTTGEVFLRLTHHVPPDTTIIVDESFIWFWFYTDYDYRQRGFEIEVTRTHHLGMLTA